MSDSQQETVVHSEGDRIVANVDGSIVEGDWESMQRAAKKILAEAEEHKTDLQKVKEMAAGVHVRLRCECCDYTEEEEYARNLWETPEDHADHPDFDCSVEDIVVEAFCPRHGVVPLAYDECDACASNRSMMNR